LTSTTKTHLDDCGPGETPALHLLENVKSYVVFGIMLMAGVMPSIDYAVVMGGKYWSWMVLMAGFMGFYTLFLRVPLIIKFVCVSTFLMSFFSRAPSISFTQYINVVLVSYFFMLCLKIKNFDIIERFLMCLILFHSVFYIAQIFHVDSLLNFGQGERIVNFGIIGQNMQSASFMTILAAVLMPFNAGFIIIAYAVSLMCNSAGSFLALSVGTAVYLKKYLDHKKIKIISAVLFVVFCVWMILSGKIVANLSASESGPGRIYIWWESIKLTCQHPFVGYGIGTYRGIFMGLTNINSVPWTVAHNCWIQLLFETGFIFFSVIVGYYIHLFITLYKLTKRKVFKHHVWKCFCAGLIVSLDMMVHFPTRMLQSVFLIIFFTAYLQRVVYNGIRQS